MALTKKKLISATNPLMMSLAEPVSQQDQGAGTPQLGAMTKWKTFVEDGAKWNYDYHDDDD